MSMIGTVRETLADAGLKVRYIDAFTRDGCRQVLAHANLGTKNAKAVERKLRSKIDLTRFAVKGKTVRITAVL